MTADLLVDAALLDVDGVLVDTEVAVLDLWRAVCRARGVPVPPEDVLRELVVGVSPERSARLLLGDADPGPALAEVAERERHLDGPPLPGARGLLELLTTHRVPLALVTGASPERLRRTLGTLGADEPAPASVTWGESRGKPAPDPYRLAAERLGTPPGRCLVLEDAVAGVLSGVAAGCRVVGVLPPRASPASAAALLDAGAHAVVPGLGAFRAGRTSTGLELAAGRSVTADGRLVDDAWTVRFGATAPVMPRPDPKGSPAVAHVILPAILAERAGGARSVPVSAGSLDEALRSLGDQHPEVAEVLRARTGGLSRFVNVYVNEVDVRTSGGLEALVRDGDEVLVVPAVAGG